MKKLNRKGFTLVELLAVIVILAIVVGIAIPGVTNVINGAKHSALGVAVEAALDHLKDQYDMYLLDTTSVTEYTKEIITAGNAGNKITYSIIEGNEEEKAKATKALEGMGFKPENVYKITVKMSYDAATLKPNICVVVNEIPTKSDYYTTAHWNYNAAAGTKPEFGTVNGSVNSNYYKENVTGACSGV